MPYPMVKTLARRLTLLLLGVAIGAGVVWSWPRKPVFAYSSDRNDKFSMTTALTGPTSEAVFVLDFLTGQLKGFSLGRTSERFMMVYSRSIAQDFQVDPNKPARYALVSGLAQRSGRGATSWAASYLYVAELSTGRVQAYAIPFRQQRTTAAFQLVPVPGLNFAFAEPRETD